MNTTLRTLMGIAAGIGIGLAAASVAAPGWGGGYGNCPWQGQGGMAQTQPGGGPGYGPGNCGMGRGMGPGMGRGMGRGMGGGNPEARIQQRLDGLRSGLAITAEQEPAWQAYADQMKAQASSHAANRAAMRAMRQSGDVTALQRMEQHEAFMAQRQAAVRETNAAFRTLYEQLTPEQRLVADRTPIGPGMGPGMGRGRGRGMGPGMSMGPGMGPRW